MKYVIILLACALLVIAQTTVPLSSIRALGNGLVLVVVDNWPVPAALDGLEVDTSGTQPILRVTANGGTLVPMQRVDYVITSNIVEFGVPTPFSDLLVYRNGMLMSIDNDYTIAGGIVRFVVGQAPQLGDIVILRWAGSDGGI